MTVMCINPNGWGGLNGRIMPGPSFGDNVEVVEVERDSTGTYYSLLGYNEKYCIYDANHFVPVDDPEENSTASKQKLLR